jgi:hypothetical protein
VNNKPSCSCSTRAESRSVKTPCIPLLGVLHVAPDRPALPQHQLNPLSDPYVIPKELDQAPWYVDCFNWLSQHAHSSSPSAEVHLTLLAQYFSTTHT